MRKQKDINNLAAAEAAKNIPDPATMPDTPVIMPAAPVQPTSATAQKRKSPTSKDDEGFKTVQSKKDKRVSTRTQPSTFNSRNVQPTMAFSQILRQGNEEKSVGPARPANHS
ncbi:hypothetical protein CDAR_510461 [Caerostris darwini]|uniref:Uncharacterized protein n=1 Tax=Caerostris darwini TaxID=1538125 RepID=A0AAV4SGX6_9ARAC|nr:hypothetical protein CDAR_510461 [Caerostris darwini]